VLLAASGGCDADLANQNPAFPKDTFVKKVCTKTCGFGGCRRLTSVDLANLSSLLVEFSKEGLASDFEDRRLQVLGNPSANISVPIVTQINMKGPTKIKVLGNIHAHVDIDSTRYLRSDLEVNIMQRLIQSFRNQAQVGVSVFKILEEMKTQSKDFCSETSGQATYCTTASQDTLMGKLEDVLVRPGVTDCGNTGPLADAFKSQDETKWVYCIFFMVIGLACICGGSALTMVFGRKSLIAVESLPTYARTENSGSNGTANPPVQQESPPLDQPRDSNLEEI
jgi:hypothetical protein